MYNLFFRNVHSFRALFECCIYLSFSSSAHSSAGVGVVQEAESEVTSVVFRDRPSVKSLASRFERNSSRRKTSVFSSTSARKRWRDFEKKVQLLSPPLSLPFSFPPSLTLSLPISLFLSLSHSLSLPLSLPLSFSPPTSLSVPISISQTRIFHDPFFNALTHSLR